jgi:hypothetical protein
MRGGRDSQEAVAKVMLIVDKRYFADGRVGGLPRLLGEVALVHRRMTLGRRDTADRYDGGCDLHCVRTSRSYRQCLASELAALGGE